MSILHTRRRLTADTIYSFGRNGELAPMVASDLRQEAARTRASYTGRGGWSDEHLALLCLAGAHLEEQEAAVIDRLMPLGRAAVEAGCLLVGTDLSPDDLVAAITATFTAPAAS